LPFSSFTSAYFQSDDSKSPSGSPSPLSASGALQYFSYVTHLATILSVSPDSPRRYIWLTSTICQQTQVILFQGDPREFIAHGKQEFNLDPIAVGYSQVVGTLVLDFLVLFFPLPMIFTLQMPLKRKIGVALVFWLGLFCCIAALVRVVLIHRLHKNIIDAPSLVYTQATQFIFLLTEPHASIIAACLPCYAPLWGVGKDIFLRSYRSMFSLSSKRSLRSQSNVLDDRQSSGASNEHLSPQPAWASNQNKVHIESYDKPPMQDSGILLDDVGVIRVTRGVDVVSK
jgi:hypothetical protein